MTLNGAAYVRMMVDAGYSASVGGLVRRHSVLLHDGRHENMSDFKSQGKL